MNSDNLKIKDANYIANTYARFDVCIKRGKGATCEDYDGKRYIDFSSGIGVNSLGFCDAHWSKAICKQAKKLNHTSNLFYTAPDVKLAKKLCTRTGYDKVFFANSGAEANEGAIKLARKKSFDKYGSNRSTIISLVNSFHGRTVTTLSATGQDVFHNYFYPFTEGFVFAKANDLDDLKQKLDGSVCGILCELIQGEGGVIPLDKEYVQAVAKLCEEHDLTFIVDEVQTGIGRTGTLLCSEQYGVRPNVTTLAKGLGGGLPIGAVLMDEHSSQVLGYGDHATTFGGNPIVCAGANAVLGALTPELLEGVAQRSAYIRKVLENIDEVEAVDGIGLMLGVTLKTKKSVEVLRACAKSGLLVLTAKHKLRLLPPLNISWMELEQGLEILKDVLCRPA